MLVAPRVALAGFLHKMLRKEGILKIESEDYSLPFV